jgi:DNA repair protein RecO (recombination protein O)
MEWQDHGLIIGARRHGETSLILEAMTFDHGRHRGLVKGGRSRRLLPLLQVGNSARFTWRARLGEHLGLFNVEPTQLRTARLLEDAEALHAMGLVASLLRMTAEREPHPALCATGHDIADHLFDRDLLAERLVRFEMQILAETGFGLDLARCAATGSTEHLVYVSPKSGRAVSLAAGAPYRERLLALPAFLRSAAGNSAPSLADLWTGFALTGYFLRRDLYEPRGEEMPAARSAYLAAFGKRTGLFDHRLVTNIPSALLPMLE